MARNTDISLRNKVIYSIFVRNYSEEGTFKKVEEDLDRIKNLGVDIIWLMPIHPIGKEKRKGTLGSPYAIRDYRSINPEYGTLEDFESLVDSIHKRGMKCIIDVVYNHTSPDSVLFSEHPEWFYKKNDGTYGNKVGDWSDIIDLDYSNKELWDYQIDTLKMWAETVDGFRCDVAPLVPVEFWEKARSEVAKVKEDCIWLAESVEYDFINTMRRQGFSAHSDAELYRAFDICYDYDIYEDLLNSFTGNGSLSTYLDALNRQEFIYPENYIKLHFIENHDRIRAHCLAKDSKAFINLTAFLYFMKGTVLIYNGQEIGDKHNISLFEKDPVEWKSGNSDNCPEEEKTDIQMLMRKLYEIKKKEIFRNGFFECRETEDNVIYAVTENSKEKLIGLFSLDPKKRSVKTDIEDGIYKNLIDDSEYRSDSGVIKLNGTPVIIEVNK